MNRIIIIGNGFDLAHGLKTRYDDFINWYWGRWLKILYTTTNETKKDELFEIRTKYNFDCLRNYFHTCYTEGNVYNQIEKVRKESSLSSIISPFLERISKSIETKGWVDIEADYYAMLVKCKGKKDELERLNKDFAIIQGLLVEYLNEIQEERINEEILIEKMRNQMLSPFSVNEVSIESTDKWFAFLDTRFKSGSYTRDIKSFILSNVERRVRDVREFISVYKKQECNIGLKSNSDVIPPDMLYPDRVMLLNFNYTKTADLYLPNNPLFIVNHIHGELSNPESVIFGYGDESDDEYKTIVKQNDNEFLKHIKTNRYLETDKYRQLLSFVNSAPFQVCIMGHSCGLSDKTMLNTLFEHDNCVSIKPYYYINEQGKDNYLDIVQNISRNFTNPQLMRDRVVNKTFCEPLPQLD